MTSTTATMRTRPGWQVALIVGLLGGIAATVVGAIGVALDVPMEVQQPGGLAAVPLAAYVPATLVATAVGAVLAAQLARRVARPRQTWITVAWVLTVLSCVQPFVAAPDTATAVVLALSHLAAAAIVIPGIGRTLPAVRQ